MTDARRLRILVISAAAVTALFRYLSFSGFPNDHFVHLTGAQQMLFGEWPTRDFTDPGLPLMYALSAAGQALFGHTFLAEVMLVCAAFAGAAALTALAAFELTGSVLLSACAVALEVLIFPRSYGYPKVLLYAAAFVLFARYIQRQTWGRLVGMAVMVAIAFLFRHDHGLYLGIGGVLTVALTPAPAPTRRVAAFAGLVIVLTLPYLLYIQVNGGLAYYLRTAVAFSQREAEREGHVWPTFSQPAFAALVYLFHLLPFVALAIVAVRRRTENIQRLAARIVPLAVVAILVNVSFIRDPLNTRLPDAIVPAALLGAWLLAESFRTRAPRITGTIGVAVALVAVAAVMAVGDTAEQIDRMGLTRQAPWTSLQGMTAVLRQRFFAPHMPSDAAESLVPFYEYLDRCTTPRDHLLIGSFLPEVAYYARRPFAGGQSTFTQGYYYADENQQRVVERLQTQSVPFVVITRDDAAVFDREFPIVAAYVAGRFRHLADVQPDGNTPVMILVDKAAAGPVDSASGWPCLHPQS